MKEKKAKVCAATRVGGQAVLEGIMMKSGNRAATAVRLADGTIKTNLKTVESITKKYKILKLPIIRGFVNFVETLILSMSTLTFSAEAQGIEEEQTRFEKWLEKHFGKSVMAIAAGLGTVLGLLLAVLLFFYLPMGVSKGIDHFLPLSHLAKSVIEGVVKIAIFLIYIALVGLMPDIRRTFEYHGAEHKSIFCHEQGLELTVENIKRQSRFHPRCGTSFMFVMMFLGIIISLCLPESLWNGMLLLRLLVKLLILPITVGLGYEIIIFAGTHDNIVLRALTAPGKWIQRLTTKEPDEREIECAIVALKMALPDVYPEQTVFDGIEQGEKTEE